VRLVWHRVGLVDRERRARKGGGEVAHLGMGEPAQRLFGRDACPRLLRREIEASVGANVIDGDKMGRRSGLLERLGDHDSNWLVIVLDLWGREHPRDVVLPDAERLRISCVAIAITPGERIPSAMSIRVIRPLPIAAPRMWA
jgi:hypothetical protein